MKLLIVLLLSALTLLGQAVDLSKPVPRIRLPDGRILKDVTFVNFRTVDVFVRHSGGSMVVRYEVLPSDIRAAAEQKRPGGPRWFPGDTASGGIEVEGQVFVQTRGSGPYKFGEATVYAFEAQYLDRWKSIPYDGIVKLPKPLAEAETDADGKFKINVPPDTPFFLFCQASRLLIDGSRELNEWRVPSDTFKSLNRANLTGENTSPRSRVEIEPVK